MGFSQTTLAFGEGVCMKFGQIADGIESKEECGFVNGEWVEGSDDEITCVFKRRRDENGRLIGNGIWGADEFIRNTWECLKTYIDNCDEIDMKQKHDAHCSKELN